MRRTVRAAEDPGVEGRLAVEPVRDAEAAVHAQPPRPSVALLVAAAAAAVNAVSLVRAPHGLRPCPALQLQASAWLPRARCNSSSSAVYADSKPLTATRKFIVARVPPDRDGIVRDATRCFGSAWPH